MSSIKPLPYPSSFNDNKYSSWGDNTRPCVLCSIGVEFNDYHLLRHSQTTGRAEAFNDALMKEPIKEFDHEPFDFFDDFDGFDFEDVELIE